LGARFGNASKLSLPAGPLIAWYGDDFTGAAATMEVLTFAGLPSVLFLDPPTPDQMAQFNGYRGIGLAGTARAQTPEWMEHHLRPVFDWLKSVRAKIAHYKICSTFDSSPAIGSIGKAMDLAATKFNGSMPILVAAPVMRRYQAFGTLFASSPDGVARLDRHSIMARHPVTPMTESDLRLVLAAQTKRTIGLVSVEDLVDAESADGALIRDIKSGAQSILLDTMSHADLTQCGRLIWQNASPEMLAIGSQGVEYALVAHWREQGSIPAAPPAYCAGQRQMIAVSGSTSIITAAQIEHAETAGFSGIALSAAACLGDEMAFGRAYELALSRLSQGGDVLIYSAKGPEDLGAFHDSRKAAGLSAHDANQRLGETLGRLLFKLLGKTGIGRAAISGGDTSGHATRQLGIYALTALAPTLPGASLCQAHSANRDMHGLELALKGGQMGSVDYFDWIRRGGGPKQI
jgi:3-oxoisoapionate kinase